MNTDPMVVVIRANPVRMWIPKTIGYVPWAWLKRPLCRAFLRFAGVDMECAGEVTKVRLSLELLDKGAA